MTTEVLKQEGFDIIKKFCELNNIPMPKISFTNKKSRGLCGFYNWHSSKINIITPSCAKPTINPGFKWSFPHYFVDKTILGVMCHEFGHYLHEQLGYPNMKNLGDKITGYEPNVYERFAETIKIFLTNPDLLKQYNRERYDFLTIDLKLIPIHNVDWRTQLNIYGNINEKYIKACENRIKSASKKS